MENKFILENSYKVNYDSAKKFVAQGNLPAAKECFKKAGNALLRLSEITTGQEKAKHINNARMIGDMLGEIEEKLNPPKPKPATPQNDTKKDKSGESQPEDDIPPPITVEEAMEKLNSLEGLFSVKQKVKEFLDYQYYLKKKASYGMKIDNGKTNHMVFYGNPGTGKTTVARIMAQILRAIGVITKGQLIEVTKKDLVGEYVGHTAPKTQKQCERALGGVLFIDEAYQLSQEGEKNSFGKEAIETLMKFMEDNRDDFVVIIAGYEEPIKEFIRTNPGLLGRFKSTNWLNFEDYTAEQLYNIFCRMCMGVPYYLTPEANEKIKAIINKYCQNKSKFFGNARSIRNFFEAVEDRHAGRIVAMNGRETADDMHFITEDDLFEEDLKDIDIEA